MAVVIFIVTLTVAGPAFPLIIAALVPFRLLVMGRIWSKDILRFVDRWACREGTPEDEGHRGEGDGDDAVLQATAVQDVESGVLNEKSAVVSSADNRVERRDLRER